MLTAVKEGLTAVNPPAQDFRRSGFLVRHTGVIVATGATPRILTGAEPDGERILTWRQLYDL
ncbi:hypothetical protein, partial [Streptosporangium sp. NPDC048865]|uniref:hypothetical protein n=1 Tax=Streptosporangium sp. NPDC048865 TaxID=3155766 RepID=UPI00341C2970